MGAFGVKIPKQYGGLGLSQVNLWPCGDVARKLGRKFDCARFGASIDRCSATVAAFWHRRAKAKISAARCAAGNFRVRADRMACRIRSGNHESARPSRREDGSAFILNGEKLWCTNGVKAGVLVVMARHGVEDRGRQGAQANHCVHRRCGHARGWKLLIAAGSWDCARFTTHREIHERARAARKHHCQGRRRG